MQKAALILPAASRGGKTAYTKQRWGLPAGDAHIKQAASWETLNCLQFPSYSGNRVTVSSTVHSIKKKKKKHVEKAAFQDFSCYTISLPNK